MKSIRRELLIGLAISALIGTILLAMLVVHEYGFLTDNPPPMEQALIEILDHVVIPVGLFICLFGIGAFLVVLRVESRLNAASKEALSAADSLHHYQTPVDNLPAEIQPFSVAVNHLITQLQNHARQQEAFAADAAHELKTPLAILALQLDKLPAEEAKGMAEQMNALSEMIDQLLILAKSNSPGLQAKTVEIDPANLARKLVSELAPSAIASGKTLSFEDCSSESFIGLEEAVSAALRTLIVNALRITPEGKGVLIVAGPGSQFIVQDGGEGLSTSMLETLKARGVRADHAPGGTAGLGLAIADRIAAAHGGELRTAMPDKTALCLIFASGQQQK